MPDSATAPADARKAALASLHEAGAHFVRMKLLSNGDKTIAESAGYKERSATLKQVQLHNGAKQLVAVMPASLGFVVVDVDYGGEQAAAEVVARYGPPLAKVPTRGKGGLHLWYRCHDAGDIGARKWRDGDCIGTGNAVLWDAPLLAAALAVTSRSQDTLTAAQLAQLPPLSERGNGKGGDDWAEGNRNETLYKRLVAAYRRNASADEIEAIEQEAREAGLSEREIAATAESAKKGAERAGIRTLVPNAWSPAGLAFCLEQLGIGLRLNVRARRYEYRNAGKWVDADDERDARLRHEIAERFCCKKGSTQQRLKYSPEMFHDLRRALGDGLRRDPFRDWLETLPTWDSTPRIDGLLSAMFGAEDDPLTRWASRYIGLGAVQRAYEPGGKLDEVPILLGEQGVGKSAFVLAWIPDDQPEWHGDAVDLSARAKEQAEQMAGAVVSELSELSGIRKAELERLKSFVTRRDDGQFRWAYARAPVRSPRRCVFVGSTNEADCLPNDPSGNRRFVVVELMHGCAVEARGEAERVQWWAEALARYRAGERANLPRDLIPLAADRAEEHRDSDALEEEIRTALVDLGAEFTINELHDAIDFGRPLDKALQMRLGTALRNLGFKRAKRAAQRVWTRA